VELVSALDRETIAMAGLTGIFISSFILAQGLIAEIENARAQSVMEQQSGKAASNKFVQAVRPFYLQYFLPIVQKSASLKKYAPKYEKLLPSAGLRKDFTPEEFIAFKLFLVPFSFVCIAIYNHLAELGLSIDMVFVGSLVCFFLPDSWANSTVEKRRQAVLRELPNAVDLLVLSIESGMDFLGALKKVVERSPPGTLIDEFRKVIEDLMSSDLGRTGALRAMSDRLNVKEINSFVSVVIAAEETGSSLAGVLRAQSNQIKLSRMLRAEEAGSKLPGKMQLVSMPLTLIPTGIVMFAPQLAEQIDAIFK